MKSCETHTDIGKGLLQNGEVLQQPPFFVRSRVARIRKAEKGSRRKNPLDLELVRYNKTNTWAASLAAAREGNATGSPFRARVGPPVLSPSRRSA